jgi:hypothetical protein
MIPKHTITQNERWNAFENAATHSYARSIIEENKTKSASTTDDTSSKSTMNAIEYSYILFSNFNNSCFIDLM